MAVTMDMIKELKEITGAGLVDCKSVLNETDGDMDKAVEILRKKGLAKAAKKAGRSAKEGLIVTRVSDDRKKGVIVKVNCETDFVSATPEFKAFADAVLSAVWEKEYKWEKDAELPADLEDLRKNIIAKLGENILVSEWTVVTDGHWLYDYIHGNKIGVIVDYSADGPVASDEESETFMKNIAMQVTAMSPVAVTIEALDPALVAKEKEIAAEEVRKSGKPENIVEKIVEGKLRKFYEENVLLEQVFMFDEDGKLKIGDMVNDYSKKKGVTAKVESFIRIAL